MLRLFTVSFILSLCACTSLSGTKLSKEKLSTPVRGVTYYLPAKIFEVEMQFQITGCQKHPDITKAPALEYKVGPKITEKMVADLNHRYVIDYEKLNGLTKVTNTNFEIYPNGMIKSINAGVTDKSGAIFSNVIDAGFSAVRGFSLRPSSIQGVADNLFKCNSEFEDKLKETEKLEAELLGELEKDEKRTSSNTQVYKAKLAMEVARADLSFFKEKGVEKEIDEAKRGFLQKEQVFKALTSDYVLLGDSNTESIKNSIAKLKSELTFVSKSIFKADDNSLKISLGKDSLEKIYDKKSMSAMKASNCFSSSDNCDFTIPSAELMIADIVVVKPNDNESTKNNLEGIYYRQPVDVRMLVCSPGCNGKGQLSNELAAEAVLTQYITSMPQRGQLSVLTLNNKMFDDNLLYAVFNETGGITTLKFESKSKAEAASAALANATEKYRSFVNNVISDTRNERKALRVEENEVRDAKYEDYKDRYDLLKKLQELEALKSGAGSRQELERDALDAEVKKTQLLIDLKKKQKELSQYE